MPSSKIVRKPLARLALVAVFLVGCNVTLSLDDARLEEAITSGLLTNNITAVVSCPDSQPIQQGNVFACTGTTPDGQTLTITVTQTDNTGNVDWEVTAVN